MYTANFSKLFGTLSMWTNFVTVYGYSSACGSYTYYFTLLEYTAAAAYGFTFTRVRSEVVDIALNDPSLISCFAVVVS